MDDGYEDVDELNEETFGCAEDGDWELEHEQFALAHNSSEHAAPDADQLPKFWEASEDVSFLWQPDALDNYKTFFEEQEGRERGVNVEETLQKLVSEEETFEDPAILDISKKVSHQKLSGSALDKLLGAPAFPAAPANLFNTSRDIWSSNEFSAAHQQLCNSPEPNGSTNNASINLMNLLQQMAQAKSSMKTSTGDIHSTVPDVSSARGSLPGLGLEPRLAMPSTFITKNTGYPTVNNKPNFGSLANSISGLPQHDVAHQVTVNKPTYTSGVLPLSQADRSLIQLTNNFPQKQRTDTSQIQSVMTMPNQTNHTLSNFTNYAQNNNPDYIRASALHMLLMQAQNARLTSRGTAALPDARYFQYMPPPGHGPALPPPLLGPSQFTGATQTTQSVQSQMFLGPINPVTSQPLMMPHVSGLHALSPNLLPYRPLQTILTPTANSQINTAARGNSLLGDSLVRHTTIEMDEEFDPNKGSWMSEYESVGVLLMYLRPLMVSNPYVQDYYFAVLWLRRMTVSRVKQIANGQITLTTPLPVMHMPSPVPVDRLSDPTYYQHTAGCVKFVMPVASLPVLAHRSHSPDFSHTATENPDQTNGSSFVEDEPADTKSVTSSLKSPLHSTSENSSALGRPTRSNVHRPRVVVELSVASALSGDTTDNSYQTTGNDEVECSSASHATRVLKLARWRRLLLARIERMYNIVLNLDEVDVSLARVVIQNDTRNRLSQHRMELIQSLIRELMTTSCQIISDQQAFEPAEYASNCTSIRASMLELFHIRKGIRLFGTVLHYLPQHLLRACLHEFLRNYAELCTISGSLIEELSSLLYPRLRAASYQVVDIAEFMNSCFPEGRISPAGSNEPNEAVRALINSKLGLSLIFCLLDVCARLSKPEDPSNFIQFGAYFSLVASDLPETVLPLESFPHLASILPVYVKPESHPPLTAAGLGRFCRLIDPTLVPLNAPSQDAVPFDDANAADKEQRVEGFPNDAASNVVTPPLTKSVDDSGTAKRTTMVAT